MNKYKNKTEWGQTLVLAVIVMILMITFSLPLIFRLRFLSAPVNLYSEIHILSHWQFIDYILLVLGAVGTTYLINNNRRLTVCYLGFGLLITSLCLTGITYWPILSNGGFNIVDTGTVSFLGGHVRPVVIPLLIATKIFRFSSFVLLLSCVHELKSRIKTNLGLSVGIIALFATVGTFIPYVLPEKYQDNGVYWYGLVIMVVLTFAAFAAYYVFLLSEGEPEDEIEVPFRHTGKWSRWINAFVLVLGVLLFRKTVGFVVLAYDIITGEESLITDIAPLAFLFSPLVGHLCDRDGKNTFGIPLIGTAIILIGLVISAIALPALIGRIHLLACVVFLTGIGFCFLLVGGTVNLIRHTQKEWIPLLMGLLMFVYQLLQHFILDRFALSALTPLEDAPKCLMVGSVIVVILAGIMAFMNWGTRNDMQRRLE